MKRILVPHDGSVHSEKALTVATQVARAHGAEVVLVRVVDQTPLMGGAAADDAAAYSAAYEELVVEVENAARNELADRVSRLQALGLTARAIVRDGSPSATLLDCAAEEQPDLVVMATHGRTGLERFTMGSVADRLVREGTAPVLVIRHSESDVPRQLQRAVILLDGSGVAEEALPLTRELLGRPIESLRLLRVVSDPTDRGPATTYLQAVADRIASTGVKAEVMVDVGEPARIVERMAREVDLVILCTHGRSGFDRLRHGSVAERVVRDVDIPTLLVRARAS